MPPTLKLPICLLTWMQRNTDHLFLQLWMIIGIYFLFINLLLQTQKKIWISNEFYLPFFQVGLAHFSVGFILTFAAFKNSPLKPAFSRVLAVGDASGIQSPLSFGGFGALTRHLHRTTTALGEALTEECLHYEDLALINPYTPNLSVAWMFQKAMSIRKNQSTDPKFINRLLATNFEVMDSMGQSTITPFLQDVITIEGLVGSLAKSFVQDPTFMPKIVQHVGIPTLVDWLGHVTMMTWYTALHRFASPIVKPFLKNSNNVKFKFRLKRSMEAWEYGSGSDYTFDIKE